MAKCFGTPHIAPKSSIEGKQWLSKVPPATTNSIKNKHRRKAVASKSVSGQVNCRQDQASNANNKIQKCFRPRQIASESSIEDKQWLPETCPATTNSIEIKHRRQTIKWPSVLEHHIYRQSQASKANNNISKCSGTPQIAFKMDLSTKIFRT